MAFFRTVTTVVGVFVGVAVGKEVYPVAKRQTRRLMRHLGLRGEPKPKKVRRKKAKSKVKAGAPDLRVA